MQLLDMPSASDKMAFLEHLHHRLPPLQDIFARWQRDGEIYAGFLVALIGSATEFLQQELMREEHGDER